MFGFGATAESPNADRAHIRIAGARSTRDKSKSIFRSIVPADGRRAGDWKSGDFDPSPFCAAHEQTAAPVDSYMGCRMQRTIAHAPKKLADFSDKIMRKDKDIELKAGQIQAFSRKTEARPGDVSKLRYQLGTKITCAVVRFDDKLYAKKCLQQKDFRSFDEKL